MTQAPDRLQAEWAGAAVAILGGGPSLTALQVEHCMGKARVIAINDAARLAPWADLLYFCDERWYRWHEKLVRGFAGMKVTLENYRLRDEVPGLLCLERHDEAGFWPHPDGLCTGSNSGYQALQVAAHLGARKIVLLGFDMKPAADGRNHFFGEHPDRVRPAFGLFLRSFPAIARHLADRGIEVLNATPESALDCFPMRGLAEALA